MLAFLQGVPGTDEVVANSADRRKAAVPADLGKASSHGPIPCLAHMRLALRELTGILASLQVCQAQMMLHQIPPTGGDPQCPFGWGKVPGHEVAFCDRLPFLLTTEVSVLQKLLPPFKKQVI